MCGHVFLKIELLEHNTTCQKYYSTKPHIGTKTFCMNALLVDLYMLTQWDKYCMTSRT